MITVAKSVVMAGLGVTMLVAAIAPASADRGGDIAAGIIGGAVVGTIIGQSDRRPVYVAPAPEYRGPGCGELRERALIAEDRGYYERSRRLWREYHDCRGD